jgi:probable F420-dependent oxidoreductase
MTDRPFRFGVVAGYAPNVDALTTMARRTEELGYQTLVTPDPLGEHDPLTALAAVAAVTSTLHFGTFVLAVSYRDSKLLTWQAQTLHSLSGGRFELGIGTGRPDAEGRAAQLGREFGSGGQRVAMIAETVAELKRREDRPRLLLAGAGPKLLDLAAREADIVSLTWLPKTTEAEADVVIDRFRQAAGSRLGEIELGLNLISVGDEPAPWVERYIGTTTAELAKAGAVTVLPGTTDQCVATLLRWRERWGVSYITINAGFLEQFAPVVEKLSGT